MAAALITTACSGGDAGIYPASKSADVSRSASNANVASTHVPQDDSSYYGERNSSGERYARIVENPFLEAVAEPQSTFSIDVDTASYSNTRRFLNEGKLPPADAVRIEELVNYFAYDYPQPSPSMPFSITTEVAQCPWEQRHRLVRIGLKGREEPKDVDRARNLVFLVDVSGSMQAPDKLPLVKLGLSMLARELTHNDRVALVAYAGSAGLVLPSTPGHQTDRILDGIERLHAGGSTAGGAGIQLAYRVASESFIEGGINRVIIATDGDLNLGVSSQSELIKLIENKRESGVFLSVLGVGTGNLQDSKMEAIAGKGNGNYAYLDSKDEARRVLVDQANATLITIAKDVKIQVEFNPAQVAAYRLLGYENRVMANEDFADDRKDAGEIGAGHTVTALYEIVPSNERVPVIADGGLKYQEPPRLSANASSGELMTVSLRYKLPQGTESRLITASVTDVGDGIDRASADFRFAAAVVSFGMLLRNSHFKGNASYDSVLSLAEPSIGEDDRGHRNEFVGLVRAAARLGRRS